MFFISLFSACDLIENEKDSETTLVRIYDKSTLGSAYYPLDIKETSDGGFLLFASFYNDANNYVWLTPYIIKTDATGAVEWESELPSPYVNPLRGVWEENGLFYFVCMDASNLSSHILSLSPESPTVTSVANYPGLSYPLACGTTSDNGLLLQGYNFLTRTTTFSKINAAKQIVWTNPFPLIENGQALLMAHVTKRGKQYPFFVGESDNAYFFNGFFNFSFSLVFADLTSGLFTGVTNGYRYENYILSALQLSGQQFAISTLYKNNSYLITNHTVDPAAILSIEDLSGTIAPVLQTNSTILSQKIELLGQSLLVVAGTTNDNQIVLFFYDQAGVYINKLEIGDSQPMGLGGLVKTTDGGLAILAQTEVMERFARLMLIKLPEQKIKDALEPTN